MMNTKPERKITVFYCINSFSKKTGTALAGFENCDIKTVKMACSSMVKDVFLLRAFEAGADAVIVLVCPEGACRYVEGNIRANKRVIWVKKLLDEIGLGGDRLSIHHTRLGDNEGVVQIIKNTLTNLDDMVKNPASDN